MIDTAVLLLLGICFGVISGPFIRRTLGYVKIRLTELIELQKSRRGLMQSNEFLNKANEKIMSINEEIMGINKRMAESCGVLTDVGENERKDRR